MPKNNIIFILLLALYGLYTLFSILLELRSEVSITQSNQKELHAKNIASYSSKEENLSALAIHKVWGIPEYEPPKSIENNETNSSDGNESFELRNENGFYTIIIDKKEFDFLGVAKYSDALFGIFFSHIEASKDKIKQYQAGENIHQKVKLHKITSNSLLLIDTKSYKKIEIPYFLVDEMEFKPKEDNESNHS